MFSTVINLPWKVPMGQGQPVMVGRHLEGLEGRTAAYCKCLTVRTPEARLPWARAGRRWAWETDVHKCSAVRAGFPVWVSGAVTDISFLTDYVVITVITFWCPLLEIFIASWVILLIPGNALGPKGLVTCLLGNTWTESRTELPVSC